MFGGEGNPTGQLEAFELHDVVIGGRLESLSLELSDDHGDVVVPATLSCGLGQRLAGLDRLGVLRHERTDGFIRDQTAEAVGAEQHSIAAAEIYISQIDRHVFSGAEGLQDDIRMFEQLGLFGLELAGFDELVDQRLVARDLGQRSLSDDVRPAIAHLAEDHAVRNERAYRGGRSHTAAGTIRLGRLEDPLSSIEDGRLESQGERLDVFGRLVRVHELVDGVYGDLTRDFSSRGSSHAVAHGNQGTSGGDDVVAHLRKEASVTSIDIRNEEVILVVLSNKADIGATENTNFDRAARALFFVATH